MSVRPVTILVEGNLDEAVARRLVEFCGLQAGATLAKKGHSHVKSRLSNLNEAAGAIPCLALVDLMDTRRGCAPEVVSAWLPSPNHYMVFRVVTREIESWLLADSGNLSTYLAVPRTKVPRPPEGVPDPKQALINLARSSRRTSLRRLLVPSQESGAIEGPGYTGEMVRFTREFWDIDAARSVSKSLGSCVRALLRLRARLEAPPD